MICFLILHYGDLALTSRAVDSILRLYSQENIQVTIVDNASPNKSGEKLREQYKNKSDIHIITASENLGFSTGNNLGYHYIKEHFKPQFLIVLNNDVVFVQKQMIIELRNIYQKEPFWVAGPDIYVPQRKYHMSPMYLQARVKEDLDLKILELEREIKECSKCISLHVLKMYIRDHFCKSRILKLLFYIKRICSGNDKQWRERVVGCVLQGACFIFDQRYIENNNELFEPLTFMYGEEDILTWRCLKNDWEIKYLPEIQVWHTCQGSLQLTKMSYRQFCEKMLSTILLRKDALQICINYLNEG